MEPRVDLPLFRRLALVQDECRGQQHVVAELIALQQVYPSEFHNPKPKINPKFLCPAALRAALVQDEGRGQQQVVAELIALQQLSMCMGPLSLQTVLVSFLFEEHRLKPHLSLQDACVSQ